MNRRNQEKRGSRGSAIALALFVFLALLGAPSLARAQACSDYGGVLDGYAGDVPPSQLQIDRNCTIRNYPADNPLRTNFSFYTRPGKNKDRWLLVFDNVVHTGQMSCNSVLEHKIWFTNGSSSSIQEGCQNLLIPVEKIDKRNPDGETTATIGVPFTYTLTMPVLFDSGTETVINDSGSLNDLHSVTLVDDLNATGVDLTYLGHVAYWKDTLAPVPHTFVNNNGVLIFDDFPVIPAGRQIIVEITVVLEDTAKNAPGTQFINTAKWDFGRLIDDVFYEPLPGEWGISDPLTIAAPELVMTKTGPATLGLTLNLGQWGDFRLDVENTGLTDAWNVTIEDVLPDGATGGMCDTTPEITNVELVGASGSTTLAEGSDYSWSYTAGTCQLTFTMLSDRATVGPGDHLIVDYRTKLDSDSQDGETFTNVAGVTEWFNGDDTNPERQRYTRTLSDGTPDEIDHEDAHTVTAALFGYFFEKSVENLTTGTSPTATASPGDDLRYTLRLQATDADLADLTFQDDLGLMNDPLVVFEPGSLRNVTVPPGAVDASNPGAGTNGAGVIDVGNIDVPAGSQAVVTFDITVAATVPDDTLVLNQADLVNGGAKIADSDDPNVNGQADPSVAGDEDPTQVLVATLPVGPLTKENTQATAAVGEPFRYRITVPATPYPFDLYDVRITDVLVPPASAAEMQLLDVTKISGAGSWTPENVGTPTDVVIADTSGGIDIPADTQIEIELTVVLVDSETNVSGLTFTNTAGFDFLRDPDDPTSRAAGDPDTTEPMTIVGPDLLTVEKTGPPGMTVGVPGTYTLDVHNPSSGPAWNLTLTDRLPDEANGGTCQTAPTVLTAGIYQADGSTLVSALAEGPDFSVAFDGASCELAIAMLSATAVLDVDQRLIVTYQVSLDTDTQDGTSLTNVAGATQWYSAEAPAAGDPDVRQRFDRTLSDGTPDVLDHEDDHTVIAALPQLVFEKTVWNRTTDTNPATTASPGDVLRYRLELSTPTDGSLADLTIRDELDRLNDPVVFDPQTLTLVTAPDDAVDNSSDTGGAAGTGLLEVGNLHLDGSGDLVVIEFDVQLAAVIPNGTYATNQSQLLVGGAQVAQSDDPNTNGSADPDVIGDEDPTRVLITSAPVFEIEKISTDLTDDPDVLLAGETLRYTITVKNVGTADALDATLRDDVPVNTSYVPGSTTLNGNAVADGPGGLAPLAGGIAVHAPGDPAGLMRADATDTTDNVATLVFEVVVDPDVIDGTVISNQAFVSAVDSGVVDRPSDDPSTPIVDDPTRDVVGNAPLLFASKDVTIGDDKLTPNQVDPGDVLHYTIRVYNNGTVPATAVILSDTVPADTTYLEDTVTLNGAGLGADGGVFPLIAGIAIGSPDLPAPVQGGGGGTLSPGQFATIEFDLQVNLGVPPGTIISNQAQVATAEAPTLLTDGDGDPATGPEPTVVVVGDAQQLTITKQVAVVGGGAALPGSVLEYVVQVRNVATVAAYDVVISDDLDLPDPNQLAFVAGSATMNGSPLGVTISGSLLRAEYSTLNGPLPPGGTVTVRFRATLAANLAIGTVVTNVGTVTWNDPIQTASASVSVSVGGTPGVGILSGTLWHDADFDKVLDLGERLLTGWTVDLYRNGVLVQSLATDATGSYRIGALEPTAAENDYYELRFRAPDAGPNTALLGLAASPFSNGLQKIEQIVVPSGSLLEDLNLPIEPNGVVYGALGREPLPGVTLTLVEATGGGLVPASCFDDEAQQGQVTGSNGYYRFDLNFTSGGCPSPGDYLIQVSSADPDYVDGYSEIIPPTSDASTSPFSVPGCLLSPDDAVPATDDRCEVQTFEQPPPLSITAQSPGTRYHVHLTLDGSQIPGTSQLFNNHIPVDPVLDGAVAITKTAAKVNVSRGELVPYEITIRNELGVPLADLTLVDRLPAGFRYVKGSAQVDGLALEPDDPDAPELRWTDLGIDPVSERHVLLLLAVGAGVGEGEHVNRAFTLSSLTGDPYSGEATATVRVVPDPDFACTDVVGKVYDDANRNGLQDPGEKGLPGVRLVTPRGLVATTDAYGRYHITCAVTPGDVRGSNFALKLDDRTLPTGFRMSTRRTQIQHATRGKALRLNFAASIHRVVSLDMADPVFVPGSTEMRPQWRPRLDLLLEELEKAPAVLRLSYLADVEDESLVDRRLAAVKKEIRRAWKERGGDYDLEIEPEVFWRRGAPPRQTGSRGGGGLW